MKLNQHTTGLTLGAFAGVVHIFWSLLVALGLAQPLTDWIYWLHFVNNPLRIRQFEITTSIMLVVITSLVGYAVGFVFANVWNFLHKK